MHIRTRFVLSLPPLLLNALSQLLLSLLGKVHGIYRLPATGNDSILHFSIDVLWSIPLYRHSLIRWYLELILHGCSCQVTLQHLRWVKSQGFNLPFQNAKFLLAQPTVMDSFVHLELLSCCITYICISFISQKYTLTFSCRICWYYPESIAHSAIESPKPWYSH